jgi:hypothetical protein
MEYATIACKDAFLFFSLLILACGPSPGELDLDGDGIAAVNDVDPGSPLRCTDADQDGCDDCSLMARAAPEHDGYDPDGDGLCDLPLDATCMNGRFAKDDPSRAEACVMLTLANQDRLHFSAEAGNAPPLTWNEDIWLVAIAHSKDMCARRFFSHTNPEGLGPTQRGGQGGLSYSLAENISLNLDPRAAVYSFMEEPTCRGHRGIILSPQAIEVGIGYYICNNPDYPTFGEHHHATQNFRLDFSQTDSDYCQSATNDCEVPPSPPSTAICPDDLIDFGFCPEPSRALLTKWDCPID